MKFVFKRTPYGIVPTDEKGQSYFNLLPLNTLVEVEIGTDNPRTGQQQKAIEVYCKGLAHEFNSRDLDIRTVLATMKDGVDLPWTQDTVKELIFKKIVKAILNKDSTADLNTTEVSRVYQVCNKFTSDRMGISIEFPSRFGSGQ
jgi:hypothetical protein